MSLFPVILDVLVVDSGKERRLLAEPGLTPPAHLGQTGSAECRIKDYDKEERSGQRTQQEPAPQAAVLVVVKM